MICHVVNFVGYTGYATSFSHPVFNILQLTITTIQPVEKKPLILAFSAYVTQNELGDSDCDKHDKTQLLNKF